MRLKTLVFLTFLLAACDRSDITLLYVDSLDKILPEQSFFHRYPAKVEVCRGEHASLQFVVRSPDRISGLTASIHPVFKPSDTTLNPSNAELYFVGYVQDGRAPQEPGNDLFYSPSRYYPDPLLTDHNLDVDPNTNAALWVSIPIPKDVKPGSYEFEVEVTGKAKGAFKRKSSFVVQVYTTQMPEQTLLINNWHSHDHLAVLSDNASSDPFHYAELEKLAVIMGKYRQNAVLLSPIQLASYTFGEDGNVNGISMESFGKAIDIFARHLDLKMVAGGHFAKRQKDWKSPFSMEIPSLGSNGETVFEYRDMEDPTVVKFYDIFLDSLANYLKASGWIEKYVQHIADEPVDENADNYEIMARYIREKIPGVRIIEATHTQRISPFVDIWVPQLDHLHKDHEFFTQQREQGKEVWFYTCIWPQGNYANRFIRQPLLKTRLLHWINYKYNLTGYLHWGYNYWFSSIPEFETTRIQKNGNILPGGDCWIVYPDEGSILPSIRLEAMRDGIVDYELLKLAACKDSVKVDSLVAQVIYGFNRYESQIVKFREFRRELLELLEEKNSEME